MFVIKPLGGLCNCLRVVFSCYSYCKEKNLDLVVIWKVTSACNGFFLDYFKPIKNINFIKNNNKYNINYSSCYPYKNYKPNYEKLELLPKLKNIINNKISILNNNYISVHIRRTDQVNPAKKNNRFITDEMFIKYIDSYENKKNIYIATDNKQTYDFYKKKYNTLIKFNYHNELKGLRKTSLNDSIIDLYMCVYSDNFMGTVYSSFSDLIMNLKNS